MHRRLLDEGVQHGQHWKLIGFALAALATLTVLYLIVIGLTSTPLEEDDQSILSSIDEDIRQGKPLPKDIDLENDEIAVDDTGAEVLGIGEEEVVEKKDQSANQAVDKGLSDAKQEVVNEEKGDKPNNDGNDLPPLDGGRDPDKEMEVLQSLVEQAPLVLISQTWCPFCTEIKKVLKPFYKDDLMKYVEVDKRDDQDLIMNAIEDLTGRRSVPKVFIAGDFVGGLTEIRGLAATGELQGKLDDAKALMEAVNPEKDKVGIKVV